MSDILCCRYIIVFWNLNLISKDIFDRVRNPHLLDSIANVDCECRLCKLNLCLWLWCSWSLNDRTNWARRWSNGWRNRLCLDLCRLWVQFLPCVFNLWHHVLSANLRSLEHGSILADCVADKFPLPVVTRFNLITFHTQQIEISVNVELLHIFEDMFAILRKLHFPHIPNLLRLFPPMTHIDDFRSLHCPKVNVVYIIGLTLHIHTTTINVKVQRSRLGVRVQSAHIHRIGEVGLYLIGETVGCKSNRI